MRHEAKRGTYGAAGDGRSAAGSSVNRPKSQSRGFERKRSHTQTKHAADRACIKQKGSGAAPALTPARESSTRATGAQKISRRVRVPLSLTRSPCSSSSSWCQEQRTSSRSGQRSSWGCLRFFTWAIEPRKKKICPASALLLWRRRKETNDAAADARRACVRGPDEARASKCRGERVPDTRDMLL